MCQNVYIHIDNIFGSTCHPTFWRASWFWTCYMSFCTRICPAEVSCGLLFLVWGPRWAWGVWSWNCWCHGWCFGGWRACTACTILPHTYVVQFRWCTVYSLTSTNTDTYTHTQTKTYIMRRFVLQKKMPFDLFEMLFSLQENSLIERPLQKVHMIAYEHVQMIVPCSCSKFVDVMQLIAQTRHTCNMTISKGLCSKDGGHVPPPEASLKDGSLNLGFLGGKQVIIPKSQLGFSCTDGRSQGCCAFGSMNLSKIRWPAGKCIYVW